MTVLYADTSALVTAYLEDEADHVRLRDLLRRGDGPVLSAELARIEFASAIYAAARHGRVRSPAVAIARFEADCTDGGPISLVAIDTAQVMDAALELLARHPLYALDALHLSIALVQRRTLAGDGGLRFVTRDVAQAGAARAEGLEVI